MDVTKDGVDELILCLEQTFIILKFIGNPGNHSYEVYYIKQNERALNGENSVYWNASMYDINSDGKEKILITADHVIQNTGIRYFTQILRPDKPDNVDDEENFILSFQLFQNYPNPFNPKTKIKYSVLAPALIQIRVYDILGREVAELTNETKPTGIFETSFDASNLSSGVYIYRISAFNGERILFSESKRMILMK
jgi:hypothetical protein